MHLRRRSKNSGSASSPSVHWARGALSDLRIVREHIIVDGNLLAARNTFSGDFTYSPVGSVEPTGQYLEWEVINTFRYHDDGRLAEELLELHSDILEIAQLV